MSRVDRDAAEARGRSGANGRRIRRPSLGNDEFLRKALEIFYDRGFAGTSMDAITAAAGIGKKTVYDRYGDKENLFRAAIERAIDDWNVPLGRLRAAEADSLEDSLLAIGRILVDNVLSPAGLRLLRLTNAESGRAPSLGEHNVRYGQGPVIAYLTDLFHRRLPAAGAGVAEPSDVAETFLHLIVGGPATAAAWGVVTDEGAIERRLRLSVSIFVHGLVTVAGDGVSGGEIETASAEVAEVSALLSKSMHMLERTGRRLASATPCGDRPTGRPPPQPTTGRPEESGRG